MMTNAEKAASIGTKGKDKISEDSTTYFAALQEYGSQAAVAEVATRVPTGNVPTWTTTTAWAPVDSMHGRVLIHRVYTTVCHIDI